MSFTTKTIIPLVILILEAIQDGKISRDEAIAIFTALIDLFFTNKKK